MRAGSSHANILRSRWNLRFAACWRRGVGVSPVLRRSSGAALLLRCVDAQGWRNPAGRFQPKEVSDRRIPMNDQRVNSPGRHLLVSNPD